MQQQSEIESGVTLVGRVKFFSDEKGYGFLGVNGRKDVFVHYSAILSDDKRKKLLTDQIVEFEIEHTEKGIQAKNVKVVNG